MNLDQLKQELAEDEGCKYEIYLDHLGLPTVGIGHLITEDDPEARMNVGTPVSEERVNMLFRRDIAVTVDDCHRLYDDFKDLPEEAQLIIANMMFNLGYPRLSKFVGMKSCVDKRDFNDSNANALHGARVNRKKYARHEERKAWRGTIKVGRNLVKK
jgi:lysozyme